MGKLRSDSERRLQIRLGRAEDDRETFAPCTACEATGKRRVERGKGRYRISPCPWCNGRGGIDPVMNRALRRWLRIANANRLAGRCRTK